MQNPVVVRLLGVRSRFRSLVSCLFIPPILPLFRVIRIGSYSKIVDRPKAFYITERLDKHLDHAVRYFQEKHGIKKVDRSTIVNALLDNAANWTEEALDVVLDKVISQLTSRLTHR